MEGRRLHRSVYPTAKQKKILIEMVAKYPDLVSCKVRQGFNYTDAHKLWQNIATECNAIPGARKTWKQWKKTWQDIRSKIKRRHSSNDLPASLVILSQAERDALGFKNEQTSTNYQTEEETEFVTLPQDNIEENMNNEVNSVASYSEVESVSEEKLFPENKIQKLKNSLRRKTEQSNNCFFNCDVFSVQEQRKLQLKEDYINFKKDYLREKLKLMKEQTEALRDIARELSK